ncbi:MAG: hypothetical protein HY506_00960 [Candidatus Yanofskybacteria bacterium]|nr:hypothetical protein [Candidatus Yanofskybacteria bacterium]
MNPFIPLQKSVIPACDVDSLSKLGQLLAATDSIDGIGAYKVGFRLAIRGLAQAVNMIKRAAPDKPVIFDGQKFGNDIPDLGPEFVGDLASCGVDAVIIFPFAGPETQRVWTEACMKKGLHVIVGGEMTHAKFLYSDGGYVHDRAPTEMYSIGVAMGVRDFVVPGNNPKKVWKYRQLIEHLCADTDEKQYRLKAPGFVSQNGDITETGKVAGDYWDAIVGSAIYKKESVEAMREAAVRLVTQIRAPMPA